MSPPAPVASTSALPAPAERQPRSRLGRFTRALKSSTTLPSEHAPTDAPPDPGTAGTSASAQGAMPKSTSAGSIASILTLHAKSSVATLSNVFRASGHSEHHPSRTRPVPTAAQAPVPLIAAVEALSRDLDRIDVSADPHRLPAPALPFPPAVEDDDEPRPYRKSDRTRTRESSEKSLQDEKDRAAEVENVAIGKAKAARPLPIRPAQTDWLAAADRQHDRTVQQLRQDPVRSAAYDLVQARIDGLDSRSDELAAAGIDAGALCKRFCELRGLLMYEAKDTFAKDVLGIVEKEEWRRTQGKGKGKPGHWLETIDALSMLGHDGFAALTHCESGSFL